MLGQYTFNVRAYVIEKNKRKRAVNMFIKCIGKQLIHPKTGMPFVLKGFNFTQNYWMPSETILKTGVDDQTYKFAASTGANALRMTISHAFLERSDRPFEYNEAALQWLDMQIEHAKKTNCL
jgi:hypothetical protein